MAQYSFVEVRRLQNFCVARGSLTGFYKLHFMTYVAQYFHPLTTKHHFLDREHFRKIWKVRPTEMLDLIALLPPLKACLSLRMIAFETH